MSEHDPVNHPKHYVSHPSGVECITITEHMGFNLGNALKYIWRADEKGAAIEDLRKAKWYIEREITRRERAAESAAETKTVAKPADGVHLGTSGFVAHTIKASGLAVFSGGCGTSVGSCAIGSSGNGAAGSGWSPEAPTRVEEWFDHKGEHCPIPSDCQVAVRFRDGYLPWLQVAGDLRWSHTGESGDVVAYRITGSPKPSEWVEWHGGERPVPASARIQYSTKGNSSIRTASATSLYWACAKPASGIVRYRILSLD